MKRLFLYTIAAASFIGVTSSTALAQDKMPKHKATQCKQTMFKPLDIAAIERVTGLKGKESNGEYKITIPQNDLSIDVDGFKIIPPMGLGTWAAFQGTPERAAVAGDFTLLADEVAPVIKALVENGSEVVAVHNHMVHEQPRIFFLHYWGVGNAEQLAKGLKAALDQTGKKKNTTAMQMHQ